MCYTYNRGGSIKKFIWTINFTIITLTLLIMIQQQYTNLKMNIKSILYLETRLELKEKINEDYNAIYAEIEENGGIRNVKKQIDTGNKQIEKNNQIILSMTDEIQKLNEENILLEEQLNELKNIVSFQINGISTFSQFPYYPTGCESVALYILLKYYGVDVTMDGIIDNLKKGDLPYSFGGNEYGGNPELEFIGHPKNDYSYGTYNEPIKEVANIYKEGAISAKNIEFTTVENLVKQNRPVIVWTTINLIEPYITTSWTYKKTGELINWIDNEHALVVIGITEDTVIASDPYSGTIRYYNKNLFIKRYNFLGKRVVYY